jgi:uncharacterized protein (TIGR02453 family)
MSFSGFPLAGMAFLHGLEADNTRAFFAANKQTYEKTLKHPMEALLQELDPKFQPLRMFRINRDVRFAKDKSPYKTQVSGTGEREGGSIYYVQLSTTGLLAASGMYMLATDQLLRFRNAIASEDTGPDFVKLVEHYNKRKGFRMNSGGDAPLKTTPRGFDKDHPRIEYLRWKGATVFCELGAPAWLQTAKVRAKIEETWDAIDPLNEWLESHVGPSTLPPPDAGRW